jgi:transposase-like protein
MAKRRHTDAEKAEALARVARGDQITAIAESYGITPKTLLNWRKAPAVPATPSVADRARAMVPPPDDSEDEGLDLDDGADEDQSSLDLLRRLSNQTQRRLRAAEAAGNHTVVQRMGRDLASMANTIARLERLEHADREVIPLTREQLIEAKSRVISLVTALASRPLHCADCARKLSVSWGREGRAQIERSEEHDRGAGDPGGVR